MNCRVYTPFLFCAALLCGARPAMAGAGRSGGEFLRVLHSPRVVAMGESGAGTYGDLLGALAANPAALARTGYREAAFAYNSWLENVSFQQAAYAHPVPGRRGVAAVSVSAFNVPTIEGFDNSGLPAAGVDAGGIAAAVHYAGRLRGPWQDRRIGLFAGGAVKYARETLESAAADAALFDAGLLWITRLASGSALALGVSAQSVGGGFEFDSVSDPAPSVLRAGASYILLAAGDPLTFALDVKKPGDEGAAVSAGAEYLLRRSVALRAGYVSGTDLGSGLRFGGGVLVKAFQFDYALAGYGGFGSAHRLSLSYRFGRPVEVTPHLSPDQERARWKTERARLLMKESRYYDAVLELNDALSLDPAHAEALDLMKKARAAVEVSR